ncbi:MAG: PLP-dependent aminotransferase family protein [Coriobacteriia bacterium]|nr:PLP-dependent aminotransferase family protein [Coriobacteriia bacterium]
MKFAKRTQMLDSSFMDEILKAATIPNLISFAGGLPNPALFPADEIRTAADTVLTNDGTHVLQYNITEGYGLLREYIANRYYPNQNVTADNILITNGSQQGLDMIARLLVDPGDRILFERPGYLGAIQAFYMAQPQFLEIPVGQNGVDVDIAAKTLADNPDASFFYGVPNFQNPTGTSYSVETRETLSRELEQSTTLYIEDNPYGEIRFDGDQPPTMMDYLDLQVISLGSFSKVLAPGMRTGWICASKEIIKGIIAIKGSTDMHTNYLSQRILHQYLMDNDFDAHVKRTVDLYREKRNLMLGELSRVLPSDVSFTQVQGGMFTWLTLPEDIKSMDLLQLAKSRNMYYIPGIPFYVGAPDEYTLRLNFSNSSDENIIKGIGILGEAIKDFRA